jgi:hypothetical protein
VVDRKNLSDHETLIRRICATPQNQFAEFTEEKLLYQKKGVKPAEKKTRLAMRWAQWLATTCSKMP